MSTASDAPDEQSMTDLLRGAARGSERRQRLAERFGLAPAAEPNSSDDTDADADTGGDDR